MAHDPPATQRLLRAMSLDALRGFEAAARSLSFTAAAEELSLSQSAVSKQVKALEDLLGRPLFVRGPRGLGLTTEGRQLHEGVRLALQQLEALLERVVQPAERPAVDISTTPSFASLWLVPRLAAFRAEAPDVDVRIDASETPRALDREGFDLAVRLARPEQAEAGWQLLARERLMLVAAPALARRLRQVADLATAPLLVFNHPVERHAGMAWAHWQARLGWTSSAETPVYQFSQYEQVLGAAAEGLGLAIGRSPLVLPALHAGALEVVLPATTQQGLGHYLVQRSDTAPRPAAHRFAQWLARSLAADLLG
ncbi:MAG: LysR family transcriptional regulator [Burkholderiales bacterium]|nr:LysR family transcriptional regulator [Burkholderiales bacterium]